VVRDKKKVSKEM